MATMKFNENLIIFNLDDAKLDLRTLFKHYWIILDKNLNFINRISFSFFLLLNLNYLLLCYAQNFLIKPFGYFVAIP